MKIHELDNVEVREDGMKYALVPIAKGERVIKYGFPIGCATEDIALGTLVHSHNLKSRLSGTGGWEYRPEALPVELPLEGTFLGYRRKNGDVGIRNELWIVPTVGCANGVAKALAEKTGAKALCHPYGCSQLGGDLETTAKTLAGLVRHPNAGGVLVLGLGCEENHLAHFRAYLGEVDEERVKFLNLQDCEDDMASGLALLSALQERMANDVREALPLSALRIGIKCG
ncbi:MAG: UxaA family hydrolase, partial [Clostridia bacterium]|nr:UxaA family hydrolase [Clostridia bacterium]